MTSKRTSSDVDRELAAMEVRARDLLAERARLRAVELERSHREFMRMLESWLCAHSARTRFVGCGGRAFWICDACETIVEKAEPEPSGAVIVNVASPESIVRLLDSPGGEAAIMSVLRARGPRVWFGEQQVAGPPAEPPRRCTAPNCGRLETEHTGVRHPFTAARIEPAGYSGRSVADCAAKFDHPNFGGPGPIHQLGRDPAADAALAREFQLPEVPPPAPEPLPAIAPPPVGRAPDDTPF